MPLNMETFSWKVLILSLDFDNTHITVPDGSPSLTPYTKANIGDGYVIPQISQLYNKSELFRKQNWFGAVHPNVEIDAKLDYMISRVLP